MGEAASGGAGVDAPAADTEFARRLALLTELGSLDAAVAALVPASDRERLRRLALPRLFDAALAGELLTRGGSAPPALPPGDDAFARLVAADTVETVPRLPGFYRLGGEARARYLRDWDVRVEAADPAGEPAREDAVTYAALQQLLVEHFRARGAGWEDEVLYHLLAADPAAARPLFAARYAEAEARFDLTACYALLAIVEERADTAAWARDELAARRARLQARALTSEDYYRTSRYYERAPLRAAFDALLDGRAPWVLELHALGGMGKTHFLRWAVARYCVPHDVPVARVDFDFVRDDDAGEGPLRFVGRLARALADQLASPALMDVARRAGEYADVAEERGTSGAGGPDDLVDSFLDEFAQGVRQGPVLLILDTMEEARARRLVDVPAVLRLLARLHERQPGLRLILAGRFTLAEHFPAAHAALGGGVRTVELKEFTPDEARAYLRDACRVADDAMVEAMVRAGQGVPFMLALLADVHAANPSLGPDEIGRRDVGVQYLVERVLKRVPQYEVRWLLRYGVVPRRLTQTFVAGVMLPFLTRAMSGDVSFDDPAVDEVDQDLAGNPLWTRNRETPPIDEMWESLAQYAGASSWVSRAQAEPDALVVHPVVAGAMRAVLRPQRVVRALHQAATEHFAARATADPGQRARWYREELFHRGHFDHPGAAARWRALMRGAAADPGLRHALATEAIAQAADGAEWPREHLLAEAHLGVARACLDLAAATPPAAAGTRLAEGRAALADARALEGDAGRPLLPPAEVALVEARLLQPTNPNRAFGIVRDALDGVSDRATRLEFEALAGELALAGRLPGGWTHFAAAIEHARDVGDGARAVTLGERLALYLAEFDRIRAALAACEEALEGARREAPERIAALLTLLGTLRLRFGAPAGALDAVAPVRGDIRAPVTAAAMLVRVRALLDLRRPAEALGEVENWVLAVRAHVRVVDGESEARATAEIGAALRESQGQAYRALLDHGRALDAFDAARGLWREIGGVERAERCLQQQIELQLHDVGNFRHARRLLDQAAPSGAETTSAEGMRAGAPTESAFTFAALRAEWLDRTGDGARAAAVVDAALEQADAAHMPRALVRLALAGLARRHRPAPPRYLSHLRRGLEAVDGGPARLALLGRLARCAPVPAVPDDVAESFVALLRPPWPGSWTVHHLTHPDPTLLEVRMADVYRVLGRPEEARVLLRAAAAQLADAREVFVVRELLRAADRVGGLRADAVDPSGLEARFAGSLTHFPDAGGTLLLERARRALAGGDRAGATAAADEAAPLLDRADGLRTAAQAQLAEVRASLAPRTGVLSRVYFLRRAHDFYDQLGDELARQRVGSELATALDDSGDGVPTGAPESDTPSSDDPGPAGVPTLALRVDGEDERATVTAPAELAGITTPLPIGALLRPPVAGSDASLLAARGGAMQVNGTSRALLSLAVRLWEGEEVELKLRTLIPEQRLARVIGAEVGPPPPERAARVRLDLGTPPLHAIPWELLLTFRGRPLVQSDFVRGLYRGAPPAAAARARVRFAQQALTRLQVALFDDGIDGTVTREALRGFQTARGLSATGRADEPTIAALVGALRDSAPPRPAVTVVQPSAAHARRALRSVGPPSLGVARFYERRGFAVEMIEDPDLAQIERRLRGHPPAVLHLCAGLEHSPTLGCSILDFANIERGYERGYERGSSSARAPDDDRAPVTAAALARTLEKLPGPAPLVVLDVPRPSTLTDAARQLLLRNGFAGELHLLDAAAAVLAIGFGEEDGPGGMPDVYAALAAGLAEALPFDVLAGRLQRLGRTPDGGAADGRTLATRAIALYAAAPDLIALPAVPPTRA